MSYSLSDDQASTPIPEKVLEVLKSAPMGYLSLSSKKGDLYSYPMAFYYSNLKIYIMTPIKAAKMKLMKANPNVSFLVDNKKLTLDSCGVMMQGKVKIISMAKMIASIISLGPKMASFAKKYPGMFTFYARGKYTPNERKLYKYRFIRIEPSKVVYWTGYDFRRYILEKNNEKPSDLDRKSDVESLAGLLASADEELESEKMSPDPNWLSELDSAVSGGILSEDEMRIMSMNRIGISENVKPGELSAGEKSILKKWKALKNRE